MANMGERLDVILFGVTGLVGRYGAQHLHKLAIEKKLTWGVAGRNEHKIRTVMSKLEEETGDKSLAKVPIILADMQDEQSLRAMTSRARVLIQSCGPLRVIGEKVVEACIETKTHYVDVSAEENFIDKIQLEYNQKAKEAGIYMVGSCGIDCIAYDVGVLYLQKKFPGTVNSVETYLKMDTDDPSLTGPSYNVSTWKSTIDLMLNKRELKALQAKIFSKNMPKLKPSLGTKHLPFKPSVENGWAILLTGSDRSVVMRTQEYLYHEKNKRPVQVQTYYMLKALWYLIFFVIFGLMFAFLLPFKAGRKILMRYPGFFSGGVFGNQEPSEEMCKNAWFRLTFVAKGWKDRIVGPDPNFNEKPNRGMMLQIKGHNPGYGGTGLCLVLAGVVLATETSKLPSKYGVYTPGIAFGETTLAEQLNERGLYFNIISEFDI